MAMMLRPCFFMNRDLFDMEARGAAISRMSSLESAICFASMGVSSFIRSSPRTIMR